jgi:hypothetical protein
MRVVWLALSSLSLAVGAVVAYALLLRVPAVRNHPGAYLAAFALAAALAVLALARGRGRRWPAWVALGVSVLLLGFGTWFNLAVARVPAPSTVLRVGERAPEFTLPDAAGRPVSLAEFRGKKPVVLVFYRGYW